MSDINKVSIVNLDEVISNIQSDIETMNSNKDITKNTEKYNNNLQKIKECKMLVDKVLKDINEFDEYLDNESSEELLDDKEFLNYLNEIEEIRKKFNTNTITKLNEVIEFYKISLNKTNKCKAYLENQKIEISNLD